METKQWEIAYGEGGAWEVREYELRDEKQLYVCADVAGKVEV
jgi:hypothetical protein